MQSVVSDTCAPPNSRPRAARPTSSTSRRSSRHSAGSANGRARCGPRPGSVCRWWPALRRPEAVASRSASEHPPQPSGRPWSPPRAASTSTPRQRCRSSGSPAPSASSPPWLSDRVYCSAARQPCMPASNARMCGADEWQPCPARH